MGASDDDFDDDPLFKAAMERVERRKAIKSWPPGAYAWRMRAGDKGTVMIGPDPSRPGKWRATEFDEHGEPVGHSDAEDFPSAVEAAHWRGADFMQEPVLKPKETPKPSKPEESKPTQTGPKGGVFYVTVGGAKVYVKK